MLKMLGLAEHVYGSPDGTAPSHSDGSAEAKARELFATPFEILTPEN